MASTGLITPSTGNLYALVSGITIDADSFVSYLKVPGGIQNDINSIAAPAVRSTVLSATIVTANTTTTVAHGLKDSEGNPVAPVASVQLAAPAAGDVIVSVTAPDATNLYLSGSATGTYSLRVDY